MSSENDYKEEVSVTEEIEAEDDGCLCHGKVPVDCRMDFQHVVTDPKTGKPKWKAYLRYHKRCPVHGIERDTDASRS